MADGREADQLAAHAVRLAVRCGRRRRAGRRPPRSTRMIPPTVRADQPQLGHLRRRSRCSMWNGFSQVAGSAPSRRDVEQAVGDADGPLTASSVVARHDRDARHRAAVEVADGDRGEGDAEGEGHQDERRGHEQRAACPVAVLAPGDDPGVRQERIAAGPSGGALDDGQVARPGASVRHGPCPHRAAARRGR